MSDEEQIQESLAAPSRDVEPLEAVGWVLFAGGALGTLVTLARRQRSILDWILPVTLLAAGGNVLMARRRSRIDTAGERILAELDHLDPIARAQVLKAVTQEELNKLPGLGSSD